MNKYEYNPWPLGKIPENLQRQEPDIIKGMGYKWNDPREIIDLFEKKVADFAGSTYAISFDCCTNAIFSCIKYLQSIGEIDEQTTITIPDRTYVSVPMQIIHSGCKLNFEDIAWSGLYQLKGTRIWDSAGKFTKNMFLGGNSLQVLSFQIKKIIPIGKGGMVLTNDKNAYEWLKLVSYDGRDLSTPYTSDEHIQCLGYHFYMTPEDAARGIILMHHKPEINEDSQNSSMYPSLMDMLKKILKR